MAKIQGFLPFYAGYKVKIHKKIRINFEKVKKVKYTGLF
jgi:hypothetical protein